MHLWVCVCIWICGGSLFNFKAWSLDPEKIITQYQLDIWKYEWGLPQSPIYAILQSSDGYLWLGTRDGLICFDGIRFRIFAADGSTPIKNNYIRALYEDRGGKLWFGAGAELVCLDRSSNSFKQYPVGNSDPLHYHKVSCISGSRKGSLWIGTVGAGIFRFKNDCFTSFTSKDGLSHNEVYDILEDSSGNLWVATLSGLDLLKLVDGRLHISPLPINKALAGTEVYCLFEDKERNLWIGTEKGLIKQSPTGGKNSSSSGYNIYTTREGLSHNSVLEIFEDRRGNLWIGTNGGGLNRMKSEKFTALTTAQGLSGNYILSIYEDREGSLWVGTASVGLNRLKDTNFTTFSTREGLSDDMVRCVTEDRKGNIWIGTPNGLNCLERDNGEVTIFTSSNGLYGDSICAVQEDSRENLWVGTTNGLNRIAASSIAGELKGVHVSCIFEDNDGDIWIGTEGGGLFCNREGRLKTIAAEGEFMRHRITSISDAPGDGLWIGTDGGGLNHFSNSTFTNYSTHHGLSDNCVFCLHVEKNGILWIGTYYGGLNRFKDKQFVSFAKKGGFFNFEIHRILEDQNGEFWITSDKGIFRAKKKDLNDFADGTVKGVQAVWYNETDGMRSRVCNGSYHPAGCKSKNGKLWFPTIKGVSTIDPNHITRNTLPPPVVIEEIIVDNKPVKTFFEQLPREAVTFPAGSKNFEFHYSGLSYLCPQKVKFRYKLDGYDIEWQEVGERRSAYYTNIPAGHYTFRVDACNNDGLWNNIGAAFRFHLRPYFYQTPWFYLLCALTIGVLIRGFIRRRIKSLKKRKMELERLVEDRTRMLEQANLELSRLATLDGLTGIHNYYWFGNYLEREWRRAVRNVTSISIILIDVDFFKVFNDTYGHQAGDECLKKIASKLQETCRRPGDAVARYGGEEFIVILPETGSTEAAIMAEKMRKGIENMDIPHKNTPVKSVKPVITISVGYASAAPKQEDEPAQLIKAADEALYLAKQQGRNRSMGSSPG